MRMKGAVLWFFLLLGVVACQQPTTTQKPSVQPVEYSSRRAILFGIGQYSGLGYDTGLATNNDANDLGTILAQSTKPYEITKLTGRILVSDVNQTISSIAEKSTKDDLSIIYFSGISDASKLYTSDLDIITSKQLRTLLDTIAGTKILLLDCSYSGSFISDFQNTRATTEYSVLASCGSSENCYSLPDSSHGYFTKALCSVISEPYSADLDPKDHKIALNEIFAATRDSILKDLGGTLYVFTPVLFSTNSGICVFEY